MGTASIKGNDGKAKKERLFKRLGTVVCSCLGLILLVEMGGLGRVRKHRRRKGLRSLNPALFNQRRHQLLQEKENAAQALTKDEKIDLVLSASVHLVSIQSKGRTIETTPGSYEGVSGAFCQLNWKAHKASPSEVPMFRDLVGKSPDCDENEFRLDLKDIVARARKHDEEIKNDATLHEGGVIDGVDAALLAVPRAMEPKGVVFHESRCGSTLVANSLAAFDPERNRVYSESAPPISAMKICGDEYEKCSKSTAAAILRDVVYMMGRTEDPREENLFFKIQSIGNRFINVFTEAFPETPFVFIYRKPVEVMMSHLGDPPGGKMKNSNCVRPRESPPKIVVDLVESHGKTVTGISHEEYCAAHLATLCDSALAEMKRSSMGQPVNYNALPEVLNEVIPKHFGVPLGKEEQDRIAEISGHYSKGRGGRAHEWKDDSEQKEKMATDAIKGACALFLDDTFHELEKHRT